MTRSSVLLSLACVLFGAFANYSFFWLNERLFASLEFSSGVNWVFLPAGVNLLLVMVLGPWAALGLTVSAAFIKHQLFPEIDLLNVAVNGVIAGFGPVLAFWLAKHFFRIDPTLKDRSSKTLIQLALLFSVLSALLHQIWFAYVGQSQSILSDAPVMALGDFLGTLIVLYILKLTLFLAELIQNKSN